MPVKRRKDIRLHTNKLQLVAKSYPNLEGGVDTDKILLEASLPAKRIVPPSDANDSPNWYALTCVHADRKFDDDRQPCYRSTTRATCSSSLKVYMPLAFDFSALEVLPKRSEKLGYQSSVYI